MTTSTGVALAPEGSVGASLAAINTTIPGYQTQLSNVADALANSMNTLQAGGMDRAGDPGSAIVGGFPGTVLPNIFVDGGSTTTYTAGATAAASIAVSAAYAANPALIATASAPGPGNSNVIGTATNDSTNAQAMAALAGSSSGPDAVYRSFIGTLGTDASNAAATATSATNLATTASNNLETISGVNQNEEEVDILQRRTPSKRRRRPSTPSTSPSSLSSRRSDMRVADVSLSQAITTQLGQQEASIANLKNKSPRASRSTSPPTTRLP